MRVRTLSSLAAAVFLCAAASVQAQVGGPGRGPSAAQNLRERRMELRDRMRDRLKDMTPEQRQAARDRARQHFENLPDDQKAWIKSYRAEHKSVRDQVRAGTIDRKTAASQLKAWREANPRPRKS
jgi:Spy/CpxP family protein refolding chaperone